MRFGGARPAFAGLRRGEQGSNYTAAFAVSDQEAWWVAVNQLIDDLEMEMVVGARNNVANTNICISAVGAGEGVAMVRQRLIETRERALSESRK